MLRKREKNPVPEFRITKDHTHNKFSRKIPPVLTVPSGAVIEAFTKDAFDEQISLHSVQEDLETTDSDRVHPLTGPVFVENAHPGDVLKVTLHTIEVGDWAWNAVIPGFGLLSEKMTKGYLKTYKLDPGQTFIRFNDKIRIPLQPFPGIMGVAPDTDEMLSTIPPRANGGNMDDPNMTEGTIVYFPVFVEGALFSIGDGHAVQGQGEVCGTALESPMRFVYQLDVLKDRTIDEPQYETPEFYAVTGYGTTLHIATRKAVGFMMEYLVEQHDLSETEAYTLCSLAGDLKIAEVVNEPNRLVTMQISKAVLGMS
ncbi:MAG: acetamidase/formamidase family protein [Lewinellaceae bacterium]|nr:acetamidase/formamidase family protein [Lewinellaceae bacterium]